MRRSSRTLRALAVVSMAVLLGAACARKTDGGAGGTGGGGGGEKETVKIAFFGALSGDYKLLVVHGFQAAQLAFEQANESGDLPVNIELVAQDTGGSGDQAVPLVDKVVNDDDFVGVIGPAFSGESAAVGDRIDQAGLPFVTQSATDDALATHGWTHWFRAVGNNSDQAKPAAQYIVNRLNPNCTFVSSDGSAYGHGLAAIVEQVLSDGGAEVQPEQQVQPGQRDYSALVTKIKASGCKVMFYGGYSPEAGLIRKQMSEAGLEDVQMVGGDGIKDETFLSAAGAAGEGTLAMCPCSELTGEEGDEAQQFLEDYQAKFGTEPGIYGPEGWDVAQLYIAAIKAGKTTREQITDFLRNVQGFQGLTKTFSWQPDGELFPEHRTMFIYEDKDGAWTILGEAAELSAAA